MKNLYFHFLVIVLSFTLVSCASSAKKDKEKITPTIAQVELSNGNTLTAELLSVHGKKAHLKHKLLGNLSFKWKEISAISTDRDVKVKLEDGDRLTGKIEQAGKGNFKLTGEKAQTKELPLSKVVSVNEPPSDITWKGEALLTYTRTAGNKRTADAGFFLRGVRETEKDAISLKASYDYGTTDDELSKRSSKGLLKYSYKLSKKFYNYVSNGAAMDYFAGLELRTELGAGAGYKILDMSVFELKGELGFSHSNEDYREPIPPELDRDVNYGATRSAIESELNLNKVFVFYQLIEFVTPFDDSALWRFHSESMLGINVSNSLSLKAGYVLDHDRRAAKDIKKTDGKTLVGIGFKF